MSQIDLPEVKVILDRVAKAMELRNSVDPQAIALSFITQNATFGLPAPRIEQKGSLGAARAAWDARAALTHRYVALTGGVAADADHWQVGLPDAYRHGLAIALPTGPNELGYVIEEDA